MAVPLITNRLVHDGIIEVSSHISSIKDIRHTVHPLALAIVCVRKAAEKLLPDSHLVAFAQHSFLHYAIGKVHFENGASTLTSYHLAARHLLVANEAGITESASILGTLYLDGKGVQRCYSTAIQYLQLGARKGDGDALYKIGICHWEGLGVQANAKAAKIYYQRAADARSPGAMREVGFHSLYGTFGEQDWKKAVTWLSRARCEGHMEANLDLGRCYQHGIGVEQDLKKAFELFEEAYSTDGFGGQYMAHCYEAGIGVEQSFERATQMYREVCGRDSGWMRKKYTPYLGLALIRGHSVNRSTTQKGLKLVKDSLLEHHSAGWHVLGECYRYGYGVKEDLAQAARYYGRGARALDGSRGILACHFALAQLYETGQGLERNMEKAAGHYYSAANRMNATAQWKTAQYYEAGKHGFEMNKYKAFDFFHKAARNGHQISIRKAGEYYMKGIGIPRDRKVKRMLREALASGEQL